MTSNKGGEYSLLQILKCISQLIDFRKGIYVIFWPMAGIIIQLLGHSVYMGPILSGSLLWIYSWTLHNCEFCYGSSFPQLFADIGKSDLGRQQEEL